MLIYGVCVRAIEIDVSLSWLVSIMEGEQARYEEIVEPTE
jgi:hypothetical protein